mmetsp:Transcript_7387/g.12172  ORF Transcript_7387/g.12172 Transcript_7387/m.12172 type:complete len:221 (-) Transcript_7387:497-1159(-)
MTEPLAVLDESFVSIIPGRGFALLAPVHSYLIEELDAILRKSRQLPFLGVAVLGDLGLHPTSQLVILSTFGRHLNVTVLFLEFFQECIVLQPLPWAGASMGVPNKAQLIQQQNFVLLQLTPTLVLTLPPRPPRQSLYLLCLFFRHVFQISFGNRPFEVAVALTIIKGLELEVVGVPLARLKKEGLRVFLRVFLGGGRDGFILLLGIIHLSLCLDELLLRC